MVLLRAAARYARRVRTHSGPLWSALDVTVAVSNAAAPVDAMAHRRLPDYGSYSLMLIVATISASK